LDDDQRALVRSDVTIADELQFYLEQMYDSNHFEKSEMLEWEKKSSVTKMDYIAAKHYFEELMKATDTYAQNAGGGTTGCNKYESANHMADIGDEIRKYIANLASASASTAQEQVANTMGKTNQFDAMAMAAQIKALTDAVAKLADAKENKDPNAGGGRGKNGDRKSRHPQMTKLRNMGAYCHSHGFHPVRADHDSVNCSWKKIGTQDQSHMGESPWWRHGLALSQESCRRTTRPSHLEGEGGPQSLAGTYTAGQGKKAPVKDEFESRPTDARPLHSDLQLLSCACIELHGS